MLHRELKAARKGSLNIKKMVTRVTDSKSDAVSKSSVSRNGLVKRNVVAFVLSFLYVGLMARFFTVLTASARLFMPVILATRRLFSAPYILLKGGFFGGDEREKNGKDKKDGNNNDNDKDRNDNKGKKDISKNKDGSRSSLF